MARLIVAHAGMGTIIFRHAPTQAHYYLSTLAAWGEHRNEHQLATAQKMKELGYVYVATDAKELKELLTTRNLKPLHDLGDIASKSLIDELCKVIG